MATSEIATLCGTILQIASIIQQTGNNWYKASADWSDFPRKVDNLRRKHDFWMAQFTRYGMLSDTSLMETLREATASLEEEEASLSKRRAKCCAGCWPKLSMTIFPAQVGLRIQLVIYAFDAIPNQLRMEQEAAEALDNRVLQRPPSLAFRNDSHYVPLQASESKVYSALDNPQGHPVVLLHGLPGKGKSTLARNVALHYQNMSHPSLFQQVVFLECGPKANLLTKQFDLLQLLGPNTAASQHQEQGKTSSDVAIRRRLSRFLKHQKLLLILDDIWEGEFLKQMVDLCGVGVKCLVTSQRGDLCRGLSFSATRIQIEDIQQEVAIQILAIHAGFTHKHMPPLIQGVAKKMIEETQGSPLALASIATAIDEDRNDELEEWEAAYRNLLHLLHSEDTAHILGEKYPRSFWSAMKLSIQSLKEDSQKLLILVHTCDGPSIPEEVLQVLYLRAIFRGSSEPFEKARKDLESRELVKITSFEKQRSWSVHSLQKLFVEEEMKDRKEIMFVLLVPIPDNIELGVETRITTESPADEDEDAKVQTTLCALYFDKLLRDRVASNMGISPDRLNNLRRNAIEPITRLLGLPRSERWTTDAQSSAKQMTEPCELLKSIYFQPPGFVFEIATVIKAFSIPLSHLQRGTEVWEEIMQLTTFSFDGQIFLKFIYGRVPNENDILHLLSLPISTLPMLSALELITSVGEKISPDGNWQRLIKALVDFLGVQDEGDASIAHAAARAILQLAHNEENFEIIMASGILDEIVRILSSESNPYLQATLLNILVQLNFTGNSIGHQEIIVENPGTLVVLVKLLFNEDNATRQLAATRALVWLALTEFTKHKIAHFRGVLEQLLNLISKVTNPPVQRQAAIALANLTSGPLETGLMVVRFGVLEQLVKLLSQDDDSHEYNLSYSAARNLCNLSHGMLFMKPIDMEYVKQKFNECEGLMDGLLGLLANHIHPETQGRAVEALTYLDPARGNGACLHSARAYSRRGYANMISGLNRESLEDLNKADKIEAGDLKTLRTRRTVRARLGDFQGALADANNLIAKRNNPFHLQERGVLKRMMGDLPGALDDLNEGLGIGPDDYECLKHRGYVRFLMNDENGARSDAEMSLRIKPARVDDPDYGCDFLGGNSVEFLDYKLR